MGCRTLPWFATDPRSLPAAGDADERGGALAHQRAHRQPGALRQDAGRAGLERGRCDDHHRARGHAQRLHARHAHLLFHRLDDRNLAGDDADHFFVTAAGARHRQADTRLGAGRFGPDRRERRTRCAMPTFAYTGERGTDVWLMLGDNAYVAGTDAEYQAALFEPYPDMLRHACCGRRAATTSFCTRVRTTTTTTSSRMPTAGQAGGLPSGTEAYYCLRLRQHPLRLSRFRGHRSLAGRRHDDLARRRSRRQHQRLAHRLLAPSAVHQGLARLGQRRRQRRAHAGHARRTRCRSWIRWASTWC